MTTIKFCVQLYGNTRSPEEIAGNVGKFQESASESKGNNFPS